MKPTTAAATRSIITAAGRSDRIKRLSGRLPVTRNVVQRFVPGETHDDVMDVCGSLLESGRMISIDHLGEDTTDETQAERTVQAYLRLIGMLADHAGGPNPTPPGHPMEVSLKLSALGRALPRHGEKIALENAHRIASAATRAGVWVTIDAEDHTTTDSTLRIVRELQSDFPDLGTVLQSYLHRTEDDCHAFAGPRSRIRLCKGAYAEPPAVAFQDKPDVDAAYVRCLQVLMAGDGYPMVASHDPVMVAAAEAMATAAGRRADDWEHQMLYGIRDSEQLRLARAGRQIRVYVPFGSQWYGYFMRRLAERPENLKFFLRALVSRD
ncbi:proline dehydrogenase family protein [Nocardia sp. 348MFTsu5.1]|uniref:proline dehydrogenase family protein n=1 Tax=Nocardia sp. 348MFTsu5.1 TaxID=1172185 RepID=UPI00036444AA|nr:proline dehydrogenase family protein [Nocardia sp. 348MFTsu5.1]